jgi:thiol-disulfide isomerase/thioredoxin
VRRTCLLPLVAVLALAGGAGLAGCSGETGRTGRTIDGTVVEYAEADRVAAPEIAGELLDGSAYDAAAVRGRVVVINFWGSWCAPCRAEAADLEETYRATKADGVEFLGVNIRDERDKAKAFVLGRSTYPSLFDPPGRLAQRFDVPPNFIPATLILDRSGRIAAVIRKSIRRPELEPIVARLAAEPMGNPDG